MDQRKENRNGSRIRGHEGINVKRANRCHTKGNKLVSEERTLPFTSINSTYLFHDLLDLLVDNEKPETLKEIRTRLDRL